MIRLKFIVIDSDREETPRNRAFPVLISLPEGMPAPPGDKIKDWAANVVTRKVPDWRWVKKLVLSEKDAELSPEIGRMFEFVDWEGLAPLEVEVPESPADAYEYAKLVGGPVPFLERVISRETLSSYRYAMDLADSGFPMGEAVIAADVLKSLNYARKAKKRILCAEDEIGKDERSAFQYGEIMRSNGLWGSWKEEELARSTVWMYQYAKDHVGGVLPDMLHNAMHLASINRPSDKWIKKYFSAKKYRPKGR